MFMKKEPPSNTEGRVYVLKMWLEENIEIYKIGMTHTDRSVDRMVEILRSWFMYFRYVPRTEIRMDKKTLVPRLLEKHIHNLLKDYRYYPKYKVEGYSEMFTNISEYTLLEYLRNFDYKEIDLRELNPSKQELEYLEKEIENNVVIEDVPF